MENIAIGTTQNVSLITESAGLGKRFLALLIDYLVISGVYIGLIITLPKVINSYIVLVFLSIFLFFYNFLMEIFFNGQSIGKKALKIRVVKITGEGAGIFQYFIRALFRPVDSFLGIGLIVLIFNERNQRIGDLIAGTMVIKISGDVKIEDTVIEHIEDDYKPLLSRTQIEKLKPEHIELAKKVLNQAVKTRDYSYLKKLYDKLILLTGAQSDILPIDFIRRIIKDYTYYA
jgi:uncharacterized RDD family membrane protein YckC